MSDGLIVLIDMYTGENYGEYQIYSEIGSINVYNWIPYLYRFLYVTIGTGNDYFTIVEAIYDWDYGW